MKHVIRFSLDSAGIQQGIRELREYQDRLRGKCEELARRLADMGAVLASIEFSRVPYMGPKDVNIAVEQRTDNSYAIVASGETVLILEFGAGIRYGNGHPQAAEFGYGPGTYPGQTHAMDENGWWIPKDKGGGHTYGNPPSMAMYLTGKELRDRLEEIAREVFST